MINGLKGSRKEGNRQEAKLPFGRFKLARFGDDELKALGLTNGN